MLSLALSLHTSKAIVPATAPTQFGTGDWSVADKSAAVEGGELTLTLSTMPSNGGSAITDVEYRLDAGTWTTTGLTIAGTFDITGLTNAQSYSVDIRAVNAVGNATASATKSATPTDTVAPTVTSSTINTGTGEIDLTGVSEPGTYWGIINYSATVLTGAAIKSAVQGGGEDADKTFAVVSGANAGTIDKSGVTPGTAYLHGTVEDPSGLFSTDVPLSFTQPDVTAPILTSPTDAANGATASTGSASTDEGSGTLYAVVTTSATAPTAAQVKLGQDDSSVTATWSGNQAVSATGVQNITPSGLTASTAYTTHFMHEDAAGNQSVVSTASGFTTAAASSGAGYQDSTLTTPAVGSNPTINYPAASSGDRLMILLFFIAGDKPSAAPSGWTERLSDTSNTNIQYAVYERTAGASEPTSVGFTATYGYFVGIALRFNNAQSGGTDGVENYTYGTTITADSISVTSGSDVVEAFFARNQAVTRTGAVQTGSNGGVEAAVSVNTNVTSTSAQTGTLASAGHQFGNQIEVLKV